MADTAKLFKVAALPQTLEPNGIYFVKNATGFDLYVADKTGASTSKLDIADEVTANLVATAPTAPDPETSPAVMWWDSSSGTLFVKYESNGVKTWVEAQPTQPIPQFGATGGLNGVADTMARSDHEHNHLVVEADW